MAARILMGLCLIASVGTACILLIGYGESRDRAYVCAAAVSGGEGI